MNLSIRNLRESLFCEGTEGTQGTANKDGGSRCSLSDGVQGTEGTSCAQNVDSVPCVPSAEIRREQETANVYGPVPCVPAVPSEITVLLKLLPLVEEPGLWSDDFARWALADCLWLDRWCFSVRALHLAFCEWCSATGTVGCMPDTFEAILQFSREYPALRGSKSK
jgi:hypothetical protein